MLKIKDKILGPYHLQEDALITGMVVGDLIAEGGIQLDLRGMVTGNLIANVESNIEIYGMVVGTVINQGAEISIHGMVGNVDNNSERAKTTIAEGAVVRDSGV